MKSPVCVPLYPAESFLVPAGKLFTAVFLASSDASGPPAPPYAVVALIESVTALMSVVRLLCTVTLSLNVIYPIRKSPPDEVFAVAMIFGNSALILFIAPLILPVSSRTITRSIGPHCPSSTANGATVVVGILDATLIPL